MWMYFSPQSLAIITFLFLVLFFQCPIPQEFLSNLLSLLPIKGTYIHFHI